MIIIWHLCSQWSQWSIPLDYGWSCFRFCGVGFFQIPCGSNCKNFHLIMTIIIIIIIAVILVIRITITSSFCQTSVWLHISGDQHWRPGWRNEHGGACICAICSISRSFSTRDSGRDRWTSSGQGSSGSGSILKRLKVICNTILILSCYALWFALRNFAPNFQRIRHQQTILRSDELFRFSSYFVIGKKKCFR